MKDKDKKKEQLINEIVELRQRIAELEASAETLRESEDRYKDLFESANDLIQIVTPEGHFLYVNRAWQETLGYNEDEINSLSLFDIIHPDSQAHCKALFQRMMSGEKVDKVETEIVARDGRKIVVEGSAKCRFIGDKAVYAQCIFHDMSERKRAEEELRKHREHLEELVQERTAQLQQSEGKFRSIVDNIGIGVSLISPQMEILSLNNKMREWFPHIDVSEKPICYRTFNIPPREDICSYCPTYKTLKDGQVYESITETPAGDETRNYRIVSSPIKDKDGDVIAAIEMVEDITERKRAQEVLHTSEERYRTLVENVSLGITFIDTDYKIMMTNATIGRWFNKPTSEFIGKNCFREFEKRHAICPYCPGVKAMATGQTTEVETQGVRDDGSHFLVRVQAFPLLNHDGTAQGFIEIIEDVTKRKQAEEEYKTIIGTSIDGFWITDMQGHFLDVNDAYCNLIGYSREELLTMRIPDIEAFEKLEETAAHIRKIMEIGGDSFDTWHRCKDGRIVDIEVSVNYMKGDGGRLFVFLRDITERKRAEEDLRHVHNELENRTEQLAYSQQRLAKESAAITAIVSEMLSGQLSDAETESQVLKACLDATNSIYGMIGVINKHGKYDVTTYNSQTLNDCAFPEALAWDITTGMDIRGIWGWPMLHGEPLLCNNLKDHPDRVGQPKGHVPIESYLGVPVINEGKVVGMVAVANKPGGYTEADVETLSRLVDVMVVSRQYLGLLKEMEQNVRIRTAQLETANKELEAFSYSVSHDLRAPIRHIAGFVELLMQNTAQILDEKSVRYLNIILDSTNHMGHLIDDILSFSRMGKDEMKKSPVNLDQIVKEAMKELQTEMKGRDIAWNINSLPEVHEDSAMIKLVWVNLIANALKFTRTQLQARIEIGWNDNKDELIFYIKDNGVGFDMAYVDKLFNLFQRLHRKEDFEGTGVGLANVRRIIHRHGGRTWAEGKVDEEATFYFSLPKKDYSDEKRLQR